MKIPGTNLTFDASAVVMGGVFGGLLDLVQSSFPVGVGIFTLVSLISSLESEDGEIQDA